jgi:hypothetical protein
MTRMSTPREIVDRQLIAYNVRNLDSYCALFADDAVIRLLNGREIAGGREAIRAHYRNRFSNPSLHCTVLARTALGDYVIDHEQVVGVAEGTLEVIAIYEVRDALIRSVNFIWS